MFLQICYVWEVKNEKRRIDHAGRNNASDGIRGTMAANWLYRLPQAGRAPRNGLQRQRKAQCERASLRRSELQRVCRRASSRDCRTARSRRSNISLKFLLSQNLKALQNFGKLFLTRVGLWSDRFGWRLFLFRLCSNVIDDEKNIENWPDEDGEIL